MGLASNEPGGYLRYPTICGERVVFVCEDDLWTVSRAGGRAERLTAGVAEATRPCLSRDGRWLAFVGHAEGPSEVFLMPAQGGPARRVTFQGARVRWVAFSESGNELVYSTNSGRAFERDYRLQAVPLEGGAPRRLPLGPASAISYGAGGARVLARQPARDAFMWKRYRGGTAGTLWVDVDGLGEFRRLSGVAGNLASPCWVGERIYFISDHEGHANVYSCKPDGSGVRRHSDHDLFYARNLSSDGQRLVYHAGAELYQLDPARSEPERIRVELFASRTQRDRKLVPAERFVEQVAPSPDGARLGLCCRGKAFVLAPFDGPVEGQGRPSARYRLATFASGGRLIAAESEGVEPERLVLLVAGGSLPATPASVDLGRLVSLEAAPVGPRVALTNHRNELWLADLDRPGHAPVLIDRSRFDRIAGIAFSPDGRFVAYALPEGPHRTAIWMYDADGGERRRVTQPLHKDEQPSFDLEGRYLFFIGRRDFDPVFDNLQFDLGFPRGMRPYVVTLRRDDVSPLASPPRSVASAPAEPERATPRLGATVRVDFDGIEQRALAFPVPEGRYGRVLACERGVLWSAFPVVGGKSRPVFDGAPPSDGWIERFDLETGRHDGRLLDEVAEFSLSADRRTIVYRSGTRLRVLRAGCEPPASSEGKPARESGWVDLARIQLSIEPSREWRQMFAEGWRLQREHFWVEDLSGVDWEAVRRRYEPLVERVSTRGELSDLLWEVLGELGTSHAYEMEGDFRVGPRHAQGFLGADLEYDAERREWRIGHILTGDPWDAAHTSPLREPGLDVEPGDVIVSVDGAPVEAPLSPATLLVGRANQRVALGVRRGTGAVRSVSVLASADERPARYRDWVEANRERVRKASGGRVGYIHIPDMLAIGFAEFHRGFLAEHEAAGLVVDLRYNRGGDVSGLLLQKLARRRLGYRVTRWDGRRHYLDEAPTGVMVAVTNEQAGSDGDLFSYGFKRLGLGPLIGTRTWGGVVGTWGRQRLVDGTLTTQPELAHWFDDVGWGIENHGVDPDIEVEDLPQDDALGIDRQLERAIETTLGLLERQGAREPGPGPRLAAPPLPPRAR